MDPRTLNNKKLSPPLRPPGNGNGHPTGNGGKTGNSHGSGKPNDKPSAKARAPEQTFEEVRYLKKLIENKTPVRVRLIDGNEEVSGTIEYYDASFIRLTREGEPNLFIYKHEIKYLYEEE